MRAVERRREREGGGDRQGGQSQPDAPAHHGWYAGVYVTNATYRSVSQRVLLKPTRHTHRGAHVRTFN